MKIPFQLKNLIWYQTPFIISSLIPLITLPIFTNYLSINDYGLIALANVYGVFFVGILNLGLLLSFQRNFFEERRFFLRVTNVSCFTLVFYVIT